MSKKEFDLLVFIGRFQPFHCGHKGVVDKALELADNVLILVGSCNKAPTVRNPFSRHDRHSMIVSVYPEEVARGTIEIDYLLDTTYNDSAWVKQVQWLVKNRQLAIANPNQTANFNANGTGDIRTGLIGASKDNTSYYLKMFPQLESVNVEVHQDIHATPLREKFLRGEMEPWLHQESLIPATVMKFLENWKETSTFEQLNKEIHFVDDYKKSWEAAPYPVKHVTVDTVVEQSGHVLLVRRRSEPGKGLWALPGGHLEPDEKILDGAIRELREETKLKVPDPVLRGSIKSSQVFDDPHRSTLGRVITHAYHIKLEDREEMPKVKGTDDADKAKWVPISDIQEALLFDDHYHILCSMLGIENVY